MSLPKTFKAAVVDKAGGDFTFRDVELRQPKENEVLVKVLACGLCFTDTDIANGHLGDVFPRTAGHEIVGDVVALGSSITRIQKGDRVGGGWHGGHDNSCRACQRGFQNMCDNQEVNGVTRDGGFAEYTFLREEAVVRLPKDMDVAEIAPQLCGGVTVFNGLRKQKVEHGGLVAIQGLGGLGHLAVQFAHKMGYEVVALSTSDDKESFARELGATHYINTKKLDAAQELMKLGGADMIIQTAPNPDVVGQLVAGLAVGGKLVSLSPCGEIHVDTTTLLLRGRSVTGWPAGTALDSEETVKFAQQHGVKCMVERYKFADLHKAVESLKAGKPRFRNVIMFD